MHRPLTALAALLATACACADVAVHDAWVRATVPGQKSSGAFMQLTSTTDSTLVGARSPAAGVVEIHRTPYPLERTQARIRDAGLPEALAQRLAIGR